MVNDFARFVDGHRRLFLLFSARVSLGLDGDLDHGVGIVEYFLPEGAVLRDLPLLGVEAVDLLAAILQL